MTASRALPEPFFRGEVADGLRARLDGLADVTADGYRPFVYTETGALAGEAAQAALHLAGEYGLAPQIVLNLWNTDAVRLSMLKHSLGEFGK